MIDLANPFESSKFCITWAKDHIAELDREIDAFLSDKDSHIAFIEPDRDGVYKLLKFKLCKPIPLAIRGHTSDAVINLRSALDQALCSCFEMANIQMPTTYFPITRTKDDFENTVNGRCKGLPQDISDVVRQFQAYKGGNNALWALNKLSNTNKHGILRPVVFAQTLAKASGTGGGIQIELRPSWDSTKNEAILGRIPVGIDFTIDCDYAHFIAFNQIEFIDGEEVVGTLHQFADVVEGVVMALEGESRRIGLY